MWASICARGLSLLPEELATLFKPEGHQSDINDYFAGLAATTITVSESSAVAQPVIVSEIKKPTNADLLVTSENLNDDDDRAGKERNQPTLSSSSRRHYSEACFHDYRFSETF